MTPVRLHTLILALGLGLAATGSAVAGNLWGWKDANGKPQYSDRSPPPGVPESAIFQRPAGARVRVVSAPAASDAASGPEAAKPVLKASDPELEARKKKEADAKEAERKAQEEKLAAQRADNCKRAQDYKRTLDSGRRISRTNDKGENEILDDKGRAEEDARAREVITRDCK